MLISDIAIAQFTSATTPGVVDVMLGFVPDFAILIADVDGTNPNLRLWANSDRTPLWADALSLLVTGSSGVITRDTSGIKKYAGGEHVSLNAAGERFVDGVDTTEAGAETTQSDPKHVDQAGNPITALGAASSTGASLTTSNQIITQPGLLIPADHQAANGKNLLVAFRGNR
jgi:hypothetical protein